MTPIEELRQDRARLRDLVESDAYRQMAERIRAKWNESTVLANIRAQVKKAPTGEQGYEMVRAILATYDEMTALIQEPAIERLERLDEDVRLQESETQAKASAEDWRAR